VNYVLTGVVSAKPGDTTEEEGEDAMLWTIFVILLVLWLIGFVSFQAVGAYIHILLVIALAVLLIQLISDRRPVVWLECMKKARLERGEAGHLPANQIINSSIPESSYA